MRLPRALLPLALALLGATPAAAAPARILLTFDDGPHTDSTSRVLDELDRRDATAAFFILTGPETVNGRVYPKAESASGFDTLVREIRGGHLVACHWGGTYVSQLRFQPPRLRDPAYDATGDGVVDRISEPGTALESDLIQCRETLEAALVLAHSKDERTQAPGTIDYIRPPVWRYKMGALDVRPTYDALGMRMVLTDFRLVDGGYPIQSLPHPRQMASGTARAIRGGQREVVLTLHDSNIRTARHLAHTLDLLERVLSRRGLQRGTHWDYVRGVGDVRDTLDAFLQRTGGTP